MYKLRYAKDKVIRVVVVVVVIVVEVEIAIIAIVVEVVANNIILTLIVHNWTFYPGRSLACLWRTVCIDVGQNKWYTVLKICNVI